MLLEQDRIRLQHMREAATEALGYAEGRGRRDLDSDRQLVHSLVRCIEIIGEAAANVSPECRGQHPEIPWPKIVAMRNRLIHAYFDVNLDILWRTTTQELPPLVGLLDRMLADT